MKRAMVFCSATALGMVAIWQLTWTLGLLLPDFLSDHGADAAGAAVHDAVSPHLQPDYVCCP